MAEKGKYKTKQSEELTAYLRTMPGEHFTAADISDHFRSQGKKIGMTTVYRQLERLVDEGLVNKYFIDENSSACFAYIDPEMHEGRSICYHCRCEKCGRLIHMECGEIEDLNDHLLEHHGFQLDPRRTVFYGICENCR